MSEDSEVIKCWSDSMEPVWPNKVITQEIPECHLKVLTDLCNYILTSDYPLHKDTKREKELVILEKSMTELGNKMGGDVELYWFGGYVDYVHVVPKTLKADFIRNTLESILDFEEEFNKNPGTLHVIKKFNSDMKWWAEKHGLKFEVFTHPKVSDFGIVMMKGGADGS